MKRIPEHRGSYQDAFHDTTNDSHRPRWQSKRDHPATITEQWLPLTLVLLLS